MSNEAMKQKMITKEDLLQEWLPRLLNALKDVRQNNNAAAEETIYELYVEMKQQTLAEIQDVFGDITLEDQLSAMALELISTKKRLAEVELIMCQKYLEAEKQKPVGEVVLWRGEKQAQWEQSLPVGTKFYTHPQPKREPLTDEQIEKAITDKYGGVLISNMDICRAIEAAHGIKE